MIQTVLCLLHDAISLVSGVKWLADSSSIGFPISSIALHRLVTLLRNVIWMLPVSSWCFLLAHMFFSLYSFVIRNHAADFWPSNHPFSEGWFILGGADCTSFTFYHSIVLFVDLINTHSSQFCTPQSFPCGTVWRFQDDVHQCWPCLWDGLYSSVCNWHY